MSRTIRFAIAGVGNCASALLQGLARVRRIGEIPGVTWPSLGGYTLDDLEPVAAFDIDVRKVGRPLSEACFALPNCAQVIERELPWKVPVLLGPALDGMPPHFHALPEDRRFLPATGNPVDVTAALRASGAEALICYLPVGAQRAVEHYAAACLEAGVGMVNAMPVFIASDPTWAQRFRDARLPIVGDDVKSQVGATALHRALAALLEQRGARLLRSYQLNTGGNTDFLNMTAPERLSQKRLSKTEAVQAQLSQRLPDEALSVGPAAYIPWQGDAKTAFLRVEWESFGAALGSAEVRLQVEDSANSAGVVVDALRAVRIARDRGLVGPLEAACAWAMKHPPVQHDDAAARRAFDAWCLGDRAS